MYPLRWNQVLPQGCTIISFLLLLCLHIPSLPWLAVVWTCPLEFRQSEGGWMKPCRKLLCPGAPQGPARVSPWELSELIFTLQQACCQLAKMMDVYFFFSVFSPSLLCLTQRTLSGTVRCLEQVNPPHNFREGPGAQDGYARVAAFGAVMIHIEIPT